jgi:hypothetical protein
VKTREQQNGNTMKIGMAGAGGQRQRVRSGMKIKLEGKETLNRGFVCF